ncbi:MAG: hypothetical protein A2V89_02075 [Gammaproteobacteria bacterium RBG_16_37_9]|nr:MAG: hypothetical protein A2V89_02075 [Gammaproteobacteria bacterium RBG_16_37_9]
MTIPVKRFFYLINILTIVYIIFTVLFSSISIRTNYKNLSKLNYNIEKEYDVILDKYKKIIVLILKNELPENINYFNSVSSAAYSLPPINELKFSEPKDAIVNGVSNKTSSSSNIISAIECYNSKCIKVFVDREKILNNILKNKSWRYGEITTIPIKKATLLKISANSFLEAHKNFIITTLSYFFILYLFQSIFLFIRNYRLFKNNASLLIALDKNNQESIKQSIDYNKLYDNVLFTQELSSEYFTHCIHQLITRDIYIEEIDLMDCLRKIEKFFSYRIIKSNLKITFDHKDTIKSITSDREMVFIVLLNLIFKTIYRSKLSSEIIIKISQDQGSANIEITDIGYEYKQKLSDKIRMHELPSPVLEKLCQKAKIEIKDTKKDEVNVMFISINIMDPETEEDQETNITDDNIIKIKFSPL